MPARAKIDYTLRGVPGEVAARIRRISELEGISLNAAVLSVIERGLASTDAPSAKADLTDLLVDLPKPTAADRRFWKGVLAESRQVDPDLWR